MLRTTSGAMTLCLLLAYPASAQPSNEGGRTCAMHPPIPQVRGSSFYSDRAGSEVDPKNLREHLEQIAPLRAFATALVSDIDGGRIACAGGNLTRWAAGSALLKPPNSFSGMRERQRFTFAINLAVLKLAKRGNRLSPGVKAWLIALNRVVMDDFARRSVRDNLYVWSGAVAATAAHATENRELRTYAIDVWRQARVEIGPEGRVPSELRRGSRGLLYHAYYLSGLLVLRSSLFGNGSGDPALERLLAAVRKGSCNPGSFSVRAGSAPQLTPNREDLATIAALTDGNAKLCAVDEAELYDPLRGGRSSALPGLLTGSELRRAQTTAD